MPGSHTDRDDTPEIKQPSNPESKDVEETDDEPEIHIPDDEGPEIGTPGDDFPNR
jgi:hypothetical protein